MGHSLRLAFCSMIAALGTAMMLLTGLIPFSTYSLPILAGMLSIPVVIEIGTGWAFSIFVAESFLSIALAPDKDAVLCFILFFGYYPILKAILERKIQKKWICTMAKLLIFNIAMVLELWLAVSLLNIPIESFSAFKSWTPFLLFVVGNATFFLYDYAASMVVIAYCNRIHMVIRKWFHMK